MTASSATIASTRQARRTPTPQVPTTTVDLTREGSIFMGEHRTEIHCPGSRIPKTISDATTAQLLQALRQVGTQLLPIALTMRCSRPPSQRLLRRSRPGYRHLRYARRHCQRSRSNPTQGPSRLVKRSSTSMMWRELDIVSKDRIDFQLHQRSLRHKLMMLLPDLDQWRRRAQEGVLPQVGECGRLWNKPRLADLWSN